jgi:hypothetical protein
VGQGRIRMRVEIRAAAKRAARRAAGFYLLGGLAVSVSLTPLVLRASSGDQTAVAALALFLVVGAAVWIGGALVAMAVGFFGASSARRAARELRARGENLSVEYGRLAPENAIVAVTTRPGEVEAWLDDGDGLLALSRISNIRSVALTSQRIWSFHYYALEVSSEEETLVITFGTRCTWGAAEASRRMHLDIAQRLLH